MTYHLFGFNGCENDWDTGGMDNYKGSFDTLEDAQTHYFPPEDKYPICTYGQIAVDVPEDWGSPARLLLIAKYHSHESSTHPETNRWVFMDKDNPNA